MFVSLGSAAENIEAAVDFLRDRGERVGSLHVNVLRPFPEAALIQALAGKRRSSSSSARISRLAGDNPLARDIRTALTKALVIDGTPPPAGLPPLRTEQCRGSSPACTASARATSGPRASSAPTGSPRAPWRARTGARASDGTTSSSSAWIIPTR